MKENTNKKRISVLLLCAALTVIAFIGILSFSRPSIAVQPINGVLDLQNWSAENDGVLNLTGEWDFYWNSFVTYKDITNNNAVSDLTVKAPSVWNSYKINDKHLPGYGYSTYRLKVVNAPIGQPLAFRLSAFATSYEFYIDDTLLASDGKTGKDKEHSSPGCKPQIAEFIPAAQSFDTIIHISNFTYAQGGMGPIKFGTDEQIQSMNKAIADQDLLLIGGLTIMAFFFMSIFLLRRDDKFSLYFAFTCILLAGSAAISGDMFIFRLLPRISYEAVIKIMYVALCWFPLSIAFASGEMYPKEKSKRFLRTALIYASVMTAVILTTSVSFYSRFTNLVYAAHFIIDLYFLYVLILTYMRGRKDAFLQLLGSVIIMLCYAHEIILHSSASKLGVLIVLLFMPFAISKRLTEAYRTENDLSQKLLTLDKIKDETIAKALSAEAAFMQAQIKPHFLYNTLNTISSLCDTDPEQAGRLIDEFSDYLRRSFDFKNLEMFVLLEQELSLVKSYVEIEKARFGDEINIIFDIDDTIETKIPLLSIQPLVENAINHGLRKKNGGGTVTLSIHKVDEGVKVSVEDDGQGISEEKLKSLLLPEEGQGIGLWNIDRRLKALYSAGLTIESIVDKGTVVSYIMSEEVN